MQPNTKMSSGQATFDLKAAREIALDPNFYGNAPYLAANLNDALDEIERLQAREKEFSNMATHISATLKAFVLGSSKRTHFALDVADHWIEQYECQAKRIAELEADKAFWQKRSQTLREVCNAAELQDNKSRAALKKLGQVKRERGKALVEERARFNVAMKVVPLNTNFPNSDHKKAREQLRREGKL